MKKLAPILLSSLGLLSALAVAARAEIAVRPAVARASDPGFGQVPVVAFPALDTAALAVEDAAREGAGEPYRFAVSHPVFLTPENAGVWDRLADGRSRWRLRLRAAEAASLNLGFGRYQLPEGARLAVYAADGSTALRPFTAEDNRNHGQLWTPVIKSDDIVLELTLPEAERGALGLRLTAVNQGYRGFAAAGGPSPSPGSLAERASGSCNVDVACPEGDPHRDIIRSVARITIFGSFLCTGAMIQNTAENFHPYFLTANHCGITAGNAASVVAYWLFENSTCRPVGGSGGPGDGSLSLTLMGTRLLASHAPSDFALVEFTHSPGAGLRVFWAGWDRSGGNPGSAIAIHHPSGEEKRISFENDPLSTTSYLGDSSPGNGTHLRVADWDLGTTEGGSSGSPLFNSQKRIVGQLHGGFAACGNNSADWYGRLSASWEGGGTANSRLRDWLDPLGSGATSIRGSQPGQGPSVPAAPSALAATAQSPSEVLLSWQDNSSNETSFRIEARESGGSFSEVGSVAANVTSAIVTGLAPGTAYTFRVRARNGGGNSPYSNQASATTLPATSPPAVPRGLTATSQSPTQVLLSWTDAAADEEDVEIQVRTVAGLGAGEAAFVGSPFETVAFAGADAEALLLGGLQPDTIYNFRVRARNVFGSSGFTAEATATTRSTAPPNPCTAGATNLCLLGGRFKVESVWHNFRAGTQGMGGTVPGGTNQTGFFWFFSPTNVELVTKMLDGSNVNGAFWLFYGALSDVEYWIVATDTADGQRKTYYNPPREFCGRGDVQALPAATSLLAADGEERAAAGALAALPSVGAKRQARTGQSVACGSDPGALCLLDRFEVRVGWRNQRNGQTGQGGPLAAATGNQTGYFWFFNPANVELVVKVVNGVPVNGKFWFFFGALSDVEYEIVVTDTESGAQATYSNPPGNLCGGVDTEALDGEPPFEP